MNWYKYSQLYTEKKVASINNWYKTAMIKLATFSFYVEGYKSDNTFDNIFTIGWNLNSLLFKHMTEQDMNYFREFSQVPTSDTVTMDGTDVDVVTGTVNFYIGGFRKEKAYELLKILLEFLKNNGVKVGEVYQNKSNMFDSQVIRIPILENPKGNKANYHDKELINPPDKFSLANNNAFYIFNTVLKYGRDLWQDNVFDAKELKERIEYYEKNEIVDQSPLELSNDEILTPEFLNGKQGLSSYTKEQAIGALNRIKSLCDWAISNGYKNIYMA